MEALWGLRASQAPIYTPRTQNTTSVQLFVKCEPDMDTIASAGEVQDPETEPGTKDENQSQGLNLELETESK